MSLLDSVIGFALFYPIIGWADWRCSSHCLSRVFFLFAVDFPPLLLPIHSKYRDFYFPAIGVEVVSSIEEERNSVEVSVLSSEKGRRVSCVLVVTYWILCGCILWGVLVFSVFFSS